MDTSAKAFDGLTLCDLQIASGQGGEGTDDPVHDCAWRAGIGAASVLHQHITRRNHEGEVLTLATAGLFDQYLTQERMFGWRFIR